VKLLLDENLSRRLLTELDAWFPGSSHVQLLGLQTADDRAIWEYAEANGFAIVTKDADFAELALIEGSDPKVLLD
jgi:predicted nuclease of predicted toxin-antitoxin system